MNSPSAFKFSVQYAGQVFINISIDIMRLSNLLTVYACDLDFKQWWLAAVSLR
jgi:hypothetical protein